jgi:hypothetical protein
MNKATAFAAFLAIAYASSASALCEVSSAVESKVVPPEKAALRNAIYQEMCKRVGGALVDGDDASLKDRLVVPRERPSPMISVDMAQGVEDIQRLISRSKKPVILVYIVETTGKVSWVAMLESSGEKQLDALGVAITKALEFKAPYTLDGMPARVFQARSQFGPLHR